MELYEAVQQAGRIQDAMNLDNFLNPVDESDEPTESGFDLGEAITTYSQLPSTIEDPEDEGTPIQIPTSAEAEQALELLLLYQEHENRTTFDQLKTLRQLYTQAKARKSEQAVQVTLDNWLI